MSNDVEPEQGNDDTPEQGADDTPEQGSDNESTDWRAEAQRWKEAARRADNRAKSNSRAAAELERLRREQMSEQERAVAEAADAARLAATNEAAKRYGARLVLAELRGVAAGRFAPEQLDALTAKLDVESFLDDDGDVDSDAVAAFVESLVPEPGQRRFPDLGQGARSNGGSSAIGGDPLLRDIRAKLGVR